MISFSPSIRPQSSRPLDHVLHCFGWVRGIVREYRRFPYTSSCIRAASCAWRNSSGSRRGRSGISFPGNRSNVCRRGSRAADPEIDVVDGAPAQRLVQGSMSGGSVLVICRKRASGSVLTRNSYETRLAIFRVTSLRSRSIAVTSVLRRISFIKSSAQKRTPALGFPLLSGNRRTRCSRISSSGRRKRP